MNFYNKRTKYNKIQNVLSGDREELLARQEFIQQLSQWGEEGGDAVKAVPIPGEPKSELYTCRRYFQFE